MSGNREVRFAVPFPLLSRVSGNMNSLMKEAVSPAHGSVILEVANKGTFYRFYQFLHTGDYDDFVPQEKVDVAGSSNMSAQTGAPAAEAVDESPSQRDLFGGFSRRTSNTDPFKFPYSLLSYKEALRNLQSPLVPSKRKLTEASDRTPHQEVKLNIISAFLKNCDHMPFFWQDVPNQKQLSFENVFIGHAMMWWFAETHAIPALMDVARSKLARQLALWMIKDSNFVTEFGNLVRYTYHECGERDNSLQRLIAHFAVCVVEDVKGLKDWQELMKEVPAFCLDLIDIWSDCQKGSTPWHS